VLGRALAMRRLRLENAALERRVREHAAELEAANRELDAFTRSASHDLRSPLTVVAGFSSLLVSKLGPQLAEEQRGWLVEIELAARRMCQLIDDLMRLSRLGRQALSWQAVDMDSLVRSVIDELHNEQPEREMTLRVGELPRTMGDASLLRQVFVNLLSNAFKFTRNTEHPTIDVGCERHGEESVFFVRDNGAGFDMSRADRLFDAFQRMHNPDEFEGSGVGLSIVQRVVQRHGGKIWAEAVPGQGARFFFTLGDAAQPAPLAGSKAD
jgi:light-regulated signal transduction histidine kinase (bacteriophytochrome)